MKVAWIIGTNISAADFNAVDNVNNSGGWNNTQLRDLAESDEISELIIISVRPEKAGKAVEEINKVRIYHLPYSPVTKKVDNKLISEIYKIIEDEEPSIIDIQGTETTYSAITYLKVISCPVLITLHGIAFQCERFYTRGFPTKSLLLDRTLVDNLAFKGVLEKKRLMHLRADIERKILHAVKYVRGRTEWDRACVLSINGGIRYFHEELILRDAFSTRSWEINHCQPHRIFTTQANSPLKSLYTLLETISILKKKYEDVTLIVPGHALRRGLIRGGHDKMIAKRIRQLGIENNVQFTGNLSADQMTDELLKARVFVLQSEIENSPNSLAEAQMVGTPAVSSFTGGTPEYITHGETGFLYNSFDPVMAAMYIEKLFDDDALSLRMSENEKIVARKRHNTSNITRGLIEIYQQIIDEAGIE
jgi:glycosyltransferase involved in cell wall biosynthesis